MSSIVLRDYQQAALSAAQAYLRENPLGRPLIGMPCGSGKSVFSAELLRRVQEKGRRALYLTMSEELVSQTMEDYGRLDPTSAMRASIACAGLGKVDLSADITLGTAQSVYRNLKDVGERDLIIIDEAQCIPRDEDSMLGAILKGRRCVKIGMSGTIYRLDSGRLDEGAGAPFDKLVYQVQTKKLQEDGYLSKLRYSKSKSIAIDLAGIHTRAGEFVLGELEEQVLQERLCNAMADDFVAEFKREMRRSAIVFCVSIEHARIMALKLRERGLRAVSADSENKAERKRAVAAMRSGEAEVLCNVAIAMVGFNVPMLDMCAWMRPTQSTGLYVQGSMRVSRLFHGKEYGLIRDYAGNIFGHGYVEEIERGAIRRGNDRCKLCPECDYAIPSGARMCPVCRAVQPAQARGERRGQPKKLKLDLNKGTWLPVTDGSFHVYARDGREPSLRCVFDTGRKSYSLWIFFGDTDSWAVSKNRSRWLALGGQEPLPLSAADAEWRANLGGELHVPREILVKRNPKNDFVGVEDVDL